MHLRKELIEDGEVLTMSEDLRERRKVIELHVSILSDGL